MPLSLMDRAVKPKKQEILDNALHNGFARHRTFGEMMESQTQAQKYKYSCGRQGCRLRAEDVIETDDGIACVHCIK